jgi:hypothetical protein
MGCKEENNAIVFVVYVMLLQIFVKVAGISSRQYFVWVFPPSGKADVIAVSE